MPIARTNARKERAGAICVVRDAADLAPFSIGHYLRLGFDRIHVFDDGSTDGTYEFLLAVQQREPRLRVERSDRPGFAQQALMTATANGMIADGIRIIFPFDIDEFWRIHLGMIRERARAASSGLFVATMVQFVQHRGAGAMNALEMFRVKYRAPALADAGGGPAIPLVCTSAPKVAFKSSEPVEIAFGQHGLSAGPTQPIVTGLKVDHLPLRNAAEIDRRAALADRVLAVSLPGQSWQAAQFREAVASGRRDEVWAANSADAQGFLNAGGRRYRLTPNGRLRGHLVKAWFYMLTRHPRALLARRSDLEVAWSATSARPPIC